jgi:hypothetical protein
MYFYDCFYFVATNAHGQAESRARITVETADDSISKAAPTFIKDIEDQTVNSGEMASFVAVVRGEPTPDVSWFVNGHRVVADSPGVTISVSNCDHKLTLDSAQYAGTVLCRAGKYRSNIKSIIVDLLYRKFGGSF